MSDQLKVVCDRAHLLDALTTACSVVSARTSAPALACVKLTAKDGILTLRSSDGEVWVALSVPQVDIKEEGQALVPADKLLQIVRASEDSTLTLDLQKQALLVRGEDARFTIFGHDVKEYPALREVPASRAEFETTADVLRPPHRADALRHGDGQQPVRLQRSVAGPQGQEAADGGHGWAPAWPSPAGSARRVKGTPPRSSPPRR